MPTSEYIYPLTFINDFKNRVVCGGTAFARESFTGDPSGSLSGERGRRWGWYGSGRPAASSPRVRRLGPAHDERRVDDAEREYR